MAKPWLVAWLAVTLYKPLSPVIHSYLDIPLNVIWSVNVACLVGLLLEARGFEPTARLAAILLTLGLGTATLRPEFCRLGPSWRAIATLVRGGMSDAEPPGYRHGTVPTSAFYSWHDYTAALEYLRRSTSAQTRVANVLKGDPAITSMVNRPSAFPAESVVWLRLVKPDDQDRFARALDMADDSVVVWSPNEIGPDCDFRLDQIEAVIRRRYHPEARFGPVEIWRRTPE